MTKHSPAQSSTSFPHEAVSQLQKYIARKIKERGFENEPLHETLILLAEETGEVMKAVRPALNMPLEQQKSRLPLKTAVGAELADVINMLFAVAVCLDINLEQEYSKKERQNDARKWHREEKG
jgi:NTP pyrophosphatase (non-canonical NTP hydrolase)